MVNTFIEHQIMLYIAFLALCLLLTFSCLLIKFGVYISDVLSKYIKNSFIRFLIVLFVLSHAVALFLTFLSMISVPLAS